MKLLILPFAAALSGLGWLARGSSSEPSAADDPGAPCPLGACSESEDCRVDVDCTDRGTCVITCEGRDGRRCVIELVCSAADGGECRVLRCIDAACDGQRR